MSTLALTILFATRNGQHVLPRTLEAYCHVEKPSHSWKMVIVENGSEDSTPAILESYRRRLPLEILRHPIAGQNHARNFGLKFIEGELTILTDDDAIPDPSFLTAWSKYLNKCQDCEIFGGSVHPLFEVPPPPWIFRNKEQFDMLFAVRDLPEGPIAPDEVFGPNMAVRSSVFKKGFRFKEELGPNGINPHSPTGGETDFFLRVAQSGAKAWFAKDPRVQHIVRSNQLKSSYWAKRSYRQGRGVAQRIWDFGEPIPPNFSRPFIVDQLACLRHRIRMLSPFPLQRLNSVCAYHQRRGFWDEWAERQAISVQ
jgi:glucosyl-dolichyl phosphate glucuronosyltransferase